MCFYIGFVPPRVTHAINAIMTNWWQYLRQAIHIIERICVMYDEEMTFVYTNIIGPIRKHK